MWTIVEEKGEKYADICFFYPKKLAVRKKNHNFEHLFGLLKCRPNEIKDNNKKNDNVL